MQHLLEVYLASRRIAEVERKSIIDSIKESLGLRSFLFRFTHVHGCGDPAQFVAGAYLSELSDNLPILFDLGHLPNYHVRMPSLLPWCDENKDCLNRVIAYHQPVHASIIMRTLLGVEAHVECYLTASPAGTMTRDILGAGRILNYNDTTPPRGVAVPVAPFFSEEVRYTCTAEVVS